MKNIQFDKKQSIRGSSTVAVAAVAIALAGGGYYAYNAGLLPFGAGKEAESALKADIENLKNGGFKEKVVALANKLYNDPSNYQSFDEKDKEAFQKANDEFFKDLVLNFEYADLKTSHTADKATAELKDVKISYQSNNKSDYTITPHAKISRLIDDNKHYFFEINGATDIYTMNNSVAEKIASISSKSSNIEVKFNDAYSPIYTKILQEDVKLIEGKGSTTLITVGKIYSEVTNNSQQDTLDLDVKGAYENIVPGDLAKMFLGDIPPMTIKGGYKYKGEDFRKKLSELYINRQKKTLEEIKAKNEETRRIAAQQAAANNIPVQETAPATTPTAEALTANDLAFNGDMKITDVAFLVGDAGVALNGGLDFKKETKSPFPNGDVTLQLLQYQKLIDLLKSVVPPAEADKRIAFLSEIAPPANGNFTFIIKFDGTEKVTISGKTFEEISAIYLKHFPRNVPAIGMQGGAAPQPVNP